MVWAEVASSLHEVAPPAESEVGPYKWLALPKGVKGADGAVLEWPRARQACLVSPAPGLSAAF